MNLLGSFLHHCLAHPLLFVADVARAAGFPRAAGVLELAHDLGEPGDGPGSLAKGPSEADEDETEGLPVPPQNPLTEEALGLMATPPAATPQPELEVRPLSGSVADRMRRARAAG